MRTTLDLPDEVFRQIKAESALRGLKLKEFVTELLRAGLARETAAPGPRPRSPLPVIRRATGTVHPALRNRQIEELLAAEDARERS